MADDGDCPLPELLRSWRERALLTQEQLAKLTGLAVRTIRGLESTTTARRPRSETVKLLADALYLTEAERARLFAAVRGEPAAPPGATDVPRQLPADVAGFCGRIRHLDDMDALLAGDATTTMVISAIAGTAGVGKTALAVHWAHRVADLFPDGQLYVNLRGFDPSGTPTEPTTAVRGFLDALGVAPQRIPADPDAQAALYRSTLAGRRMLVLLDNARDTAQVHPLLPGAGSCLVVVTSRNQLTGLVAADGAHPITLDLLTPDEAHDLLARRLGTDRTAAEPDAVAEIIIRCSRLPLALAIVAARAATHPRLPLYALAGELRDTRHRLDTLTTDDPHTDVRAVFSWSYQALTPDAARLFRLLGLHPGPDISAPAAASLAGITPDAVRPLLSELTRANLVIEPTTGRYTYHDLLRAYAVEQAHTIDPDAERHIATGRMLDHYLHTAYTAARLLYPAREPISLTSPQPGLALEELANDKQAMAWFTVEYAVLLAAVGHAAAKGFDTHTWQLAWTIADFSNRRGHWHDNIVTQRAAVAAARRVADPTVQARTYRSLARAYTRLSRFEDSATELRQALDLTTRTGDPIGQAHSHHDLALVRERQSRNDEALDHARQALDLYRATGHRRGQAQALNVVGWCHAILGDHCEALTACQQALTLYEELGDRTGQAHAWDSVGYAHHHLGEYDHAISCYRRALHMFLDLGDSYYEALALTHLGDTHLSAGDPEAARTAWQQALTILDDLDHPDADQVRAKLSAAEL